MEHTKNANGLRLHKVDNPVMAVNQHPYVASEIGVPIHLPHLRKPAEPLGLVQKPRTVRSAAFGSCSAMNA